MPLFAEADLCTTFVFVCCALLWSVKTIAKRIDGQFGSVSPAAKDAAKKAAGKALIRWFGR